MKRHPDRDTPFLTLEEAYRSRGQSELADRAHVMAQSVSTAHDQAILGAILREAQDLVKDGRVTTIEK
jgi:hypothetical protein